MFVSRVGIDEARHRLVASGDLVGSIAGVAASALQAVGLAGDAASVATLLGRAIDEITRLAADHTVRTELAADLEAAPFVATAASSGDAASSDGAATPGYDNHGVSAAQARVAALEAAAPFPGRNRELAAARQALVAARAELLADLVERLEQSPRNPSLATQAHELAVHLEVSPHRLAAVAAALHTGDGPETVNLPAWLFPRWYIDARRASERRRAHRHRYQTAMWRAVHAATEAWIRGDVNAERAAWDEYRGWAEHLDHAPPVPLPSPLGLLGTMDFLSSTRYLTPPDRELAIAEFLAEEIEPGSSANRVAQIGELIGLHLTTPAAAAAFFNALDPVALAGFPFIGVSDHRLVRLVEPYAQVLALASESPSLEIAGADLVGDVLRPHSAAWLGAAQYETTFLVGLAVAIVAATATAPYVPWIAGWPAGAAPPSGDPRVAAAAEVVARGPDAAVAFLFDLNRSGLLSDFLAPVAMYADAGEAAGSILALAGASDDPRAAGLVAASVEAIAETSVQPGLAKGAAAMIVPHLTSLVDPRLAYDLEQSAAAEALSEVAQAVPGFLREILSEPAAASLVLTALTLLLFGSIDRTFEPHDPESIAPTMRGFGHLADLVTDAYLTVGVATARSRDAANARLATVVGFAADLVVAGGLVVFGPATAAAVIASEVTAAGLTGLALPALLEAAFPTDATEAALSEGYALENRIVHEAELYVLAKLHAAGMLELPDAWFIDGRLAVGESDLRAFEASLGGDFPYAEWINDAVSIGGAIGWQPVD